MIGVVSLLLTVSFILAKQPKPIPLPKTYEAAWKQVDSLTQKGLFQTALTQTNALHDRARADRNYPQLTKASVVRGNLLARLDRALWPTHIQALEADIRQTPEPARSVLQSLRGEAYATFYQLNRYRIYNRTQTAAPNPSADSTDISTWDGPRLARAAQEAYRASLTAERELQQTPITEYKVVIRPGTREGERLRPTLFDLLAHRAIDFFENTEFETQNNVFRFELDQPSYFAAPETFAALTLTPPANAGETGRMYALQTYQRLLRFHGKQTDKTPEALADADLERLRFVRQYSTLAHKDSLFAKSLEQQRARWKGKPVEAEYTLTLGLLRKEQSARYEPLADTTTQRAAKQAADLFKEIISRYPTSRTAKQATLELNELTQPSLQVETAAVNEPNKPFLGRVKYRNVPMLYYRLYQIRPNEFFTFENFSTDSDRRNRRLTTLLTRPLAAQGDFRLPDNGDLNEHAVEIPIKAVATGQYVLLVSTTPTISTQTPYLSAALLTVSQLGFVLESAYTRPDAQSVFVTDRTTGEPLSGVNVQLVISPEPFGDTTRQTFGETRQTDANGRVIWPKTSQPNNRQTRFRITRGNDVLYTGTQYTYAYEQPQPQSATKQTVLFTDRAIYRPGQPIYVKGLVYAGQDNQFAVSANEPIELSLMDNQGETLTRLSLTTNAYGSFTGSFTAPVGRLSGQMTVVSPYGQTQIQVEEYKRPTFAVVADSVRQAIKLGQTVRVSAKAQTFTGAAVDGATVRYRVTRSRQWWPWDGGFWGRSIWPPRPAQPTEIAQGEAKTDANGVVSLRFVAAPDRTIPRSDNPTFHYEITFDVTDRTGETRSTTQTLDIGYTALRATLSIPEQVSKGEAQTFAVKATNQAGLTVAIGQGEVIISRLTPPARPLRPRLWERPDRRLLTEAEFKAQFPNDVYADEDNPTKWARQRVKTAQPGAVSVRDLPPGEYVAEVSVADASGERATQQQYFSVVDEQTSSARPDAWARLAQSEVLPGQEAVFYVGNAQPGWVLMAIDEKGSPVRYEWIRTDGTPKRLTLPVTERQRGGFVVTFTMVQQGRIYAENLPVQVPFTNKQLTIETLTFRDKLKPSAPEEWTLRIGGPGQDKVAAELVAALYDASLDEFVQHTWNPQFYQPYNGNGADWMLNGFGTLQANPIFVSTRTPNYLAPIEYPTLLSQEGRAYASGRGMRLARGTVEIANSMNAPVAMAADMAQSKMAKTSPQPPQTAEPANPKTPTGPPPVIRKNFNETAFFFPQVQTDADGRIRLTFTMPDALTRWKLLAFAHTKDLKTGLLTREVVTQKELMVSLNTPRFLREGDKMTLSARINNLTNKPLNGTARLEAFDALTDAPLSQSVALTTASVSFSAGPNGSTVATWSISVPTGLPTVAFRVSATAGSFTDVEERSVPVLANQMLVTDALPFWVNGQENRSFSLSALTGLTPNSPVRHERLTVEVTGNPIWTALQSLPYLMESPYENAEQLSSRWYANFLAAHLIGSRPEFRRVVDQWAANPPKSPLMANPELKSVTLENSPWLANARSETERTAQLGELFNQNRLATEQRQALAKLQQLQHENGGFAWFSGMRPSPVMTLHVLTNLGRMQRLSESGTVKPDPDLQSMQLKAVRFADTEIKRWITERQKEKKPSQWVYPAIHYLYARSLASNALPLDEATRSYLVEQIDRHWLTESLQGQAMAVVALHQLSNGQVGDTKTAKTARTILASLKDRARVSEELGMFWPENQQGFAWYQAPIETQAYLIEAFATVGDDKTAVQNMLKWLLRQKQTQAWPSTKATTEAVNALLQNRVGGVSMPLDMGATTTVLVGGQPLNSMAQSTATSVLGYQKTTYSPAEIKPEMGTVAISKKTDGPAWGALYWQHFEPLDNVKSGTTSVSVQKTLYRQRNTANGPVIEPVTEKTVLQPGDEIKVRLVVKNDRLMEYVHLKDSRASGFEPVAALSGYKYQNGLGYYEAPRDASTDFFLDALPVGTHVFEYGLRVVQPGNFTAGVATIQCFYAPEFTAHSAGGRVNVR
ncbi:alpha-2-macroglobulin [Rudanella paleaurantiibacter]|uniref:Alpha-2-macroglobulin n=1 Tax=Rudanella paleaurantiibacter TaxID=2614655 RepID=A0A7J5U477_9BACT|nr:alpha-2-macroglobulin [Rudanella paleaurantiibacter]